MMIALGRIPQADYSVISLNAAAGDLFDQMNETIAFCGAAPDGTWAFYADREAAVALDILAIRSDPALIEVDSLDLSIREYRGFRIVEVEA